MDTINTPILGNINTNTNTNTSTNISTVRIPLCADYWLSGSSSSASYYFTGQQYQWAIIDMVETIYNSSINNSVVIILDLHWNYCTNTGQQSGTSSSNGQQQPMALSSNSALFWSSICQKFGMNTNGNQIQPTTYKNGNDYSIIKEFNSLIKPNIFFELYNEPYTEDLSDTYENKFPIYVYGNEKYIGMGQLYNLIRVDNNCSNILVISAAEQFAYFAEYTYFNYSDNNKTFKPDVVSCFTRLNNEIMGGTIPNIDNLNLYYDPILSGMTGIICNIHPYTNSVGKYPGYTIKDSSYNGHLLLENILQALTTNNNPIYNSSDNYDLSFQPIAYPIICTEYGQYSLTWGPYDGTNTQLASNFKGTPGELYGADYKGTYYNRYGNPYVTGCPAMIGYLKNFKTYNISSTLWASRPNTGNSWSSIQPDSTLCENDSIRLITSTDLNYIVSSKKASDFSYCFHTYYTNP